MRRERQQLRPLEGQQRLHHAGGALIQFGTAYEGDRQQLRQRDRIGDDRARDDLIVGGVQPQRRIEVQCLAQRSRSADDVPFRAEQSGFAVPVP